MEVCKVVISSHVDGEFSSYGKLRCVDGFVGTKVSEEFVWQAINCLQDTPEDRSSYSSETLVPMYQTTHC